MSAERRPQIYLTEREYFDLEEVSLIKHEYYQGQMYAMAGASPQHNIIAGSAFGSLYAQLRGRPCLPFTSDQRLKVEANGLVSYPDVMVVCPPLRYDETDKGTILVATVIIEVLSHSTAKYDKQDKFAFYRDLPMLRHYILIEQTLMEAAHHWLDLQTGEWQSETFIASDNIISLAAIDCTLSVAELYERIEF